MLECDQRQAPFCGAFLFASNLAGESWTLQKKVQKNRASQKLTLYWVAYPPGKIDA